MRKILRGLAVATALTLAPLSAAAISSAPAQASESRLVIATTTPTVSSTPAATAARAKGTRTILITDTPGDRARLRIVVRPEFGNKLLVIKTKRAGIFRTTGRVRTNAKGVAIKVFAGSRRGITYRLIAVGGQKYKTKKETFIITTRPK
jgi:hypothetical protein